MKPSSKLCTRRSSAAAGTWFVSHTPTFQQNEILSPDLESLCVTETADAIEAVREECSGPRGRVHPAADLLLLNTHTHTLEA